MYEFYRYKNKLENAGLMNAGSLSILEIRRKNKELTTLLKAAEKYAELVDMPLDLLFTIGYEIQKQVNKGYTPLESMMIVSSTGIGIELVLLAQSFLQEERYNFERYIFSNIVLVLEKLGLRPRQIMNIIDKTEATHYEQRTIKEILTGVKETKGFTIFKDNLKKYIDGLTENTENQEILTNLLKRTKKP